MIFTAMAYLHAGLCVLPAKRAEKRPALSTWKQYQRRLPTEQQLQIWFAENAAMCVLTGNASGNLEMIDFDHGGELFDAWCERVTEQAPGLVERLVIERSQSGGRHVVYRCESAIPGNRKLAQRIFVAPDAEPIALAGKHYVPRAVGDQHEVALTLIETRGEGGLFLCAPTPGYVLEQQSFLSIPLLSSHEQSILIGAACSLNEVTPPETRQERISRVPAPVADTGDQLSPEREIDAIAGGYTGSLLPGDDFNERGDVRDVLRRHGWRLVKGGENEHWLRPGKEQGTSATFKAGLFYIFSSNAAPFDFGRAYTQFAIYATLEHAGDFVAAAAALRAAGFGGDAGSDAVDLSQFSCNGAVHRPVNSTGNAGVAQHDDPGPAPAELFRMPGFVDEVMDHCMDTAPYPNAALAFCGALTLQAVLAGRKVCDSGDIRTNLYLLALANSAAGKDWPRKVNVAIMRRAGLLGSLGENFASGEGIQDALAITPAMLFQTDEFDGLLQSVNKARDARYEGILTTLLTFYSASNSTYSMRRKAGKEQPGTIEQPCLVVYGTAIPAHFYGALSPRMLTNGFFARILIIESGSRGPGQESKIVKPPKRVIEIAKWWGSYRPCPGNLADQNPQPSIVDADDAAKSLLIDVRRAAEVEYASAESGGDTAGMTVWGRAPEHVRKLALLYAVSESHATPRITAPGVQWAAAFIWHHARRMLGQSCRHVAETPFHGDCLRLLEKLRESPGGQLDHSTLLKRLKIDAKSFANLIDTLRQQDSIEIVTAPTGGRPTRMYRAVE